MAPARLPGSPEGDPRVTEVVRPLVSVLTPSFNQGEFIPDCLDSVSRQNYQPIEHIVCDGGSTDGTLDLLRAASDRVRWVSEPDSGQADALNKAFALSKGEIIGWLNSDDAYVDRRAVAWSVELLQTKPELDVVFGHALLINENNRALQVLGAPPFSPRLYETLHYIVQPAVFIRRSALEREPVFVREELNYVIDRDLFFRLSRRCRFGRVGHVLAADRHQRARKVLDEDFKVEAEEFDRSIGGSSSISVRLIRRWLRILIRAFGIVPMLRLPSAVVEAVPLDIPPLHERLRLQLLTARRDMPF
jgi:glycosyltransferase involved in cell wall biosynthesis